MARRAKLGTGKRFRSLRSKISRRDDVRDVDAVVAAIGRRKYGKRRFQRLAAKGRKRRR